jgi:hypothetical protein
MRKYLLILIAVFSIGWASDGGWDLGSFFTRTIRYATERMTASDTITAGESGKTFSIYCPGSVCEFELPTAQPGMSFTFLSESLKSFSIDPASTDIIRWSAPLLAAGHKLTSTGETYDSIRIISTQANYWTVEPINGTFNDGGD